LEKEKEKPQLPKLAEAPELKETTNEEAIKNLPVIQDLNIKITALAEAFSGGFTEVNKKFEGYDVQVKDTNEKITALGQAISVLNDEFSNFMKTLQAKLAPASAISGGENTPPGIAAVSSKRVDVEKPPTIKPPPTTTGDKLLQWANLLAGLAGSGQPSGASGGGGANPTDLLKLVLQLQDSAEERALKRQETSVKNIALIANLFMGKKLELPTEEKKIEEFKMPHLK